MIKGTFASERIKMLSERFKTWFAGISGMGCFPFFAEEKQK